MWFVFLRTKPETDTPSKNLNHVQNDCQLSRKLFWRFRRKCTKPVKGLGFVAKFETFFKFRMVYGTFLSARNPLWFRMVPLFFSAVQYPYIAAFHAKFYHNNATVNLNYINRDQNNTVFPSAVFQQPFFSIYHENKLTPLVTCSSLSPIETTFNHSY